MSIYSQRWGNYVLPSHNRAIWYRADSLSREDCMRIYATIPKTTHNLALIDPFTHKNWVRKHSALAFCIRVQNLGYNVYALLRLANKSCMEYT